MKYVTGDDNYIELNRIKDMLRGFHELWKNIIPRILKGKHKFYALAIESLWKFIITLIDSMA